MGNGFHPRSFVLHNVCFHYFHLSIDFCCDCCQGKATKRMELKAGTHTVSAFPQGADIWTTLRHSHFFRVQKAERPSLHSWRPRRWTGLQMLYRDAIQHVTEFYSCQKVTICHRLRSSKLCIQTVEWKKHMQKKKARVSLTAQVLHICQGSKCQGSKYIVANQLEIILHLAATNFSTKTFQSRR